MRIPFGYGQVYIYFPPDTQPDGNSKYMSFNVDTNSFYEAIEIGDRFMNLNKTKKKYIDGYHINWDLKLIDEDLTGSSNQDDLCNFMYYYNLNTRDDKSFKLIPYYSSADNYSDWLAENIFKVFYNVIVTEQPTVTNIVDGTRANGQYLHLKIETKFMIPKADYDYLVYRDTIDNDWYTLPDRGPNVIGNADLPIGYARSGANRITAANDQAFGSGNIGNWVVYTDGNGTCVYEGSDPAAEKVAEVTVGATPGTYTGGKIPTSAISAFVNGTRYRIKADVYIISGKNNFSAISIEPIDLSGWTEGISQDATVGTEDAWQTIYAEYTAAADVTGDIAIKGASTTAADSFFFDDISIIEIT